MSVSLVFLPFWSAYTPPLSLAYLHAALKHEGIEVHSFDFSTSFQPGLRAPAGDPNSEQALIEDTTTVFLWLKKILAHKPKVVGFSCVDSNFLVTSEFCRIIKQVSPGTTIVLGGARFVSEQMFNVKPGLEVADYIIQNEGEEVLPGFVKAILAGKPADGMKGVWYKDETGEPKYGGNIEKGFLNQKLFPNFDDFPLENYPTNRRIPMTFSRGCILNCNFCTNKFNDKTQRSRTAENVFEELKLNAHRYKINEYMFNDDSLISAITLNEIDRYADMVIAEGLIYPWSVYGTRVEKLLTPDYIGKLRKSGLNEIAVGVESFSSVVQKDMGKSSDLQLADKVVKMFVDAGVSTRTWLIYGYPNETDEEFEFTYQWLNLYGHLLSSIWVNPFFANMRYRQFRPNVVTYFKEVAWGWQSQDSTLAKRKERFLRLIELAEVVRRRPGSKLDYSIGDPFAIKYFTEWNEDSRRYLMQKWEEMESSLI